MIGIFFGSYFPYTDAILGILVSLFILYTAYDIFKDSIGPLLGENPDEKLLLLEKDRLYVAVASMSTEDLRVASAEAARIVASKNIKSVKLGIYFEKSLFDGVKAMSEGFVLGAYAYNGQDAASIEGAIPGIIMLMSWVPAVITVIAAIFMLIYPLNQKKIDEVTTELNNRRLKESKI